MTDSVTAVILGIVEGITEFLPVSSTGHLLITQHLLGDQQSDLFNIVIQFPAVAAVIPLFHKRFHQFIYKWSDPAVRSYALKILIAFAITGVGCLLIEKKGLRLPERLLPIAGALLLGGILFILVESMLGRRKKDGGMKAERNDISHITWNIVAAVGIGQVIAAAFPGASRSGTTILFMLILGLARPIATEYSFLVSIPTMLAASGYKVFKEFHHHAGQVASHENWQMVIIASVVAAIVSFIAVKWLLQFVQSHTFIGFGWYRVAVGLAILAYVILHGGEPTPTHSDLKAFAPTEVQHVVATDLAHNKLF